MLGMNYILQRCERRKFLFCISIFYFPGSWESVGGAIHKATVKQLPRPALGNAKILLFS